MDAFFSDLQTRKLPVGGVLMIDSITSISISISIKKRGVIELITSITKNVIDWSIDLDHHFNEIKIDRGLGLIEDKAIFYNLIIGNSFKFAIVRMR